MNWWLKAIIGCVVWGVVLIVVVMLQGDGTPSTEAQDDRLSELFGMASGIGFVAIWIWCFLKRDISGPEEQEAVLEPGETVVLDTRHCGYLKSKVALLMGKGLITDSRVLWKSNKDLAGLLTSAIFRVKFVSIPRSNIQEAAQTSFGVNKQVLHIQTVAGREYRFVVDDVNEWLEPLNKRA